PDAQGLDNGSVRRIAQPIEEQNRQRNGISCVLVVDIGPRFAQELGRLLDRRVRCGHVAFQKRESGQGGPAYVVRRPTPISGLEAAKMLDATAYPVLNL